MSLLAGCGNSYRPVLTAINPVGPAGQPNKYVVAVATNGPNSQGVVTIVDFAGDTVLINANVAPDPRYFVLDQGGRTGYTISSGGTLNTFDVSNQLQTRDVQQTTLLSGSNPISLSPQGGNLYLTEAGRNSVANLQGSPPALKQEFPVAPNPIYVLGVNNTPRAYALSQGANPGVSPGQAAAIETGTNTISSTIPVGRLPVYGIMTNDARRVFVLNSGDSLACPAVPGSALPAGGCGTVSVINSQTNQLDSTTGSITVGQAPIWADFAPTLSEMVVANAGAGGAPGSVSIVNIPLCSATTLPSNPNCNATNPVDAVGFGQVLANVAVGRNPRMVAVLQDGTRAYVVNQADSTISVVNLQTNTVTATIPVPLTPHPTFLAVTTGNPTGKVYVTSPESTVMTIIRTDTDTVLTTVSIQGNGVQVRVSQP